MSKPENPVTAKDWERAVDAETARLLSTEAHGDSSIEEVTAIAERNVSTERKARIAARIQEASKCD